MAQKTKQARDKNTLMTLGILLIAPLLLILLIYALFFTWSYIDSHKNKRLLTAAANEIKLPPNFVLTETNFQDDHCLDTCAYIVLHYKSSDGKPLDRETVNAEMERLGYVQPEYEKGYGNTRRFNYNGLHTEQLNAPPEYLELLISK